MTIDQLQINFSESSLLMMNIVIAFIMFGVALDLQVSDFKRTLSSPKPVLIGLTAQFLLLPAMTFVLVSILQPHPSIALGLFLVATCPGGNLSNFLTYLAKGNTPLSISMSAISTVAAIFMTPFNTMLWASIYKPTADLISSFSIGIWDMFSTILLMLALPLVLGMLVRRYFPTTSLKMIGFMKKFSISVFLIFIVVMVANNFHAFTNYVGSVLLIVIVHNASAIFIGYITARLLRVEEVDRRAIAIETGIQNSVLGLVLVFNFFGGLGGMAIVAAIWGTWHIVSGLIIATYWSRRNPSIISTQLTPELKVGKNN
ncbi:bile acid:sodium symporter family protein [Metabacillus fastidiosus]|uniref:bile acid:sodium symporter family protein n=1 Tax=Metabacillus fastidiosus TaxID=1458 RepID=UPI003D2D2070